MRVGDDGLLEVVEDGDAGGNVDGVERDRVVDDHLGDVEDELLGNLGRQRLDVHLAGDVLEDAALLDAGSLLDARRCSSGTIAWIATSRPHAKQVDVDRSRRGRGGAGRP